ncbi:MAG: ASKHA domain-containing protein [Deltaproteobacteria bacterium]|nr:ASKHA domain-containing protein [Deltaproteobacteria bacterium]
MSPKLTAPSLGNNTADVDRLVKGLKHALAGTDVRVNFSLVKRLSRDLRRYDYGVEAVLYRDGDRWQLIDIFGGKEAKALHGLALDLGSSTLVLRLMDLSSEITLGEISFNNPQIEIGTDILTRIHFAGREGGLAKLRTLVLDAINLNTEKLVKESGVSPKSIVGMSVAGNTTMTHLFLGLDPHWICREPYIPVVNRPDVITACELALNINPQAPVLVFPNVGSYFGGDLIAGILASKMTEQEDVSFLVDVGTNAEVVIGNHDWLMACAGAAGPALESGVADMGMMAAPGVIDSVVIDPETGEFKIGTIAARDGSSAIVGRGPIGICGSGLIDLVSELFLAGMIDLRGKFVPDRCGKRLVEMDGIRHLMVVPAYASGTGEPLTLSQIDIDGLVRSKAAMYTILTTISKTVNVSFDEIGRFFVAGTFGSYINPRSAINIGMIPDLPLDTYVSLGNTSLAGATMALLSLDAQKSLFHIRDQITYLELNVNQEFMNLFSAAKFLPHTDRSLFPSVKRLVD